MIIAELSANHNNDFDLACRTIAAMKASGADAVKLQTYTPDSLSIDVENEYFGPRASGLWQGWRPYDLYRRAALPYEWQPKLKQIAENLGLICFSSPFDFDAVDFLENIDVPAYKIASLEINDIPLIKYAASKRKPIILSTGAADIDDIGRAVEACRSVGNNEIALLKCTSEYPAPISKANLATIPHLRDTFGVSVGLSDHTLGISVAIAATALGSCIIEKHFTLDRSTGGPDSAFSLEPEEFARMVTSVRDAESSVGKVDYSLSPENAQRRRSLFATADIAAGDAFTQNNVRSVRPGFGLAPVHFDYVLNRVAAVSISRGSPISWDLIE